MTLWNSFLFFPQENRIQQFMKIVYNLSSAELPKRVVNVKQHLSHNIRKHTFGHVSPVKIQISLNILVWSESSLGTFWIAKDAKFLHSGNKDSDQTAWMCILIRISPGCTCLKVCFLTLPSSDDAEAEMLKKKQYPYVRPFCQRHIMSQPI